MPPILDLKILQFEVRIDIRFDVRFDVRPGSFEKTGGRGPAQRAQGGPAQSADTMAAKIQNFGGKIEKLRNYSR